LCCFAHGTDPGIDDTMAIFLAFNSPEVRFLSLFFTYVSLLQSMSRIPRQGTMLSVLASFYKPAGRGDWPHHALRECEDAYGHG
jgi:hypothetical protein